MDTAPRDACIIFDIDGTLADNKHRQHHLLKSPKDWHAFNQGMHLDQPIAPVLTLLTLLCNHYPVMLCTGRQEKHRTITMEWLERHNAPYTMMFMRATDDYRPDDVVKKEMLDEILSMGYHPLLVVDDRNSVVAMWRQAGLVCLQCAEGDF